MAILVSSMVIIIDQSRIKNGEYGEEESQSDIAADSNNISENSGISTARLMCAGDNLIHGSIYKQAKNRSNNGSYDFSYTYEGIKDIIALSDIAFLNQETIIDKDSEPSTYPMFNSPTELLDEMINVGFDVFNQSTNHTMDKGLSGAENDLELFKSKNNIMLTGLRETREDLLKPQTIDVNGITFSFVGFTEFLNGLRVPGDSDLGLLYLTDTRYTQQELYDTMKQMIYNAKNASDVVCVSMHWQDENITEPDSSQIAIMDKLLEYGADIVIGTGPHVLQPIEFKENGDGEQALVIWSLGNLVSCQKQRNNLLGGIADITVNKDNATGKITISEAALIPTITHYNSNFANVRIIPLVNYNEELASQHGTSSTFTYDYIVNFYNEMFGEKLKIKYK
jgi:poly-gamma-glutamate synthesis protein (capsule biosynthesis protein)